MNHHTKAIKFQREKIPKKTVKKKEEKMERCYVVLVMLSNEYKQIWKNFDLMQRIFLE